MSFSVILSPVSQSDVNEIYRWLLERSQSGANRWYAEWQGAIEVLRKRPMPCPLAPEDEQVKLGIRHYMFRTPSAKPYRAVFRVQDDAVIVLQVRGPGQPPIDPEMLR